MSKDGARLQPDASHGSNPISKKRSANVFGRAITRAAILLIWSCLQINRPNTAILTAFGTHLHFASERIPCALNGGLPALAFEIVRVVLQAQPTAGKLTILPLTSRHGFAHALGTVYEHLRIQVLLFPLRPTVKVRSSLRGPADSMPCLSSPYPHSESTTRLRFHPCRARIRSNLGHSYAEGSQS